MSEQPTVHAREVRSSAMWVKRLPPSGADVTRSCRGGHMSSRVLALGQVGLGVLGRELLGGVLVYETLVEEPIDGAALGSHVTEGVPRRDQLGKAVMEPVLEPANCSSPLECRGQTSSRRPRR